MSTVLAPKHTGMRCDAAGMLRQALKESGGRRQAYYVYGVDQLVKHLEEMADRYYAGDVAAVDEFCQLYCFDRNRPKP